MKVLIKIFLLISFVVLSSCSDQDPDLNRDGRIVGGVAISINQAPYQVALMYNGGQVCGGSIISKDFVLTAAHCTYGTPASRLSIRAGSRDRLTGGQVVPVSSVFNHPNYNPFGENFDFSILRLRSSIALDGVTKAAIGLPSDNEVFNIGSKVVTSGWGETNSFFESDRYLRAVELSIENQSFCGSVYAGKYGVSITDQMICAYSAGKDSCFGDSGGPLKLSGENKLIGVVSFGGPRCARLNEPGVYARVSSVRPWIRGITSI